MQKNVSTYYYLRKSRMKNVHPSNLEYVIFMTGKKGTKEPNNRCLGIYKELHFNKTNRCLFRVSIQKKLLMTSKNMLVEALSVHVRYTIKRDAIMKN